MERFAKLFLRVVPLGWIRTAIDVCDALGKLAILVGIVTWLWEIPDRADQRHSAAWALLNSAQGKAGNGGRTTALESLNGDGVSLAGLDLSNAYLPGIDLRYANLSKTTFRNSDLTHARFGCGALSRLLRRGNCTYFSGASFSDAELSNVDFRRAYLDNVTFTGRRINRFTDFSGALITDSRFEDMEFFDAEFSGASIYRTRFAKVEFEFETIYEDLFDGADLRDVDFSDTNIERRLLAKATLCRVQLHEGSPIDQNCPEKKK